MKITFERDSVCAGDDMLVPNRQTVNFKTAPTLLELLQGRTVTAYLPCVANSVTHWEVVIDGATRAKITHSCWSKRTLDFEMTGDDMMVSTQKVFFRAAGQSPV